ncbi:MAG: hypothetical protein A2857_06120 [Candidatus Levybacteria bacterium RIFCSPHIGHO2_01_FULL_36_15]|nr:MAG: hypothetical protein A2857_06120 [Candidatus Levybacteria bacterium RIFCSPHIGHO2_01_FULL_36_15]
MLKKRLIPCLVLKDNLIVQSIGFKKYLPIGVAKIAVEFVAKWDVDEIFLIDITATKEKRKPNLKLINKISENCFVPLTVGGGIHELKDIKNVIRAGADKISINSEALEDPDFITKSSGIYGSQCIVVSVDVKINSKGNHEVVADAGKRFTGLSPIEWARRVEKLGAGEIFLNSADRDGSKKGYDIKLIKMVSEAVRIPVIACGGVGVMSDFIEGIIEGKASAISAANIFHYTEHSTIIAKAFLKKADIDVRLNTLAKYGEFKFDEYGRILKKEDAGLAQIWFERNKS